MSTLTQFDLLLERAIESFYSDVLSNHPFFQPDNKEKLEKYATLSPELSDMVLRFLVLLNTEDLEKSISLTLEQRSSSAEYRQNILILSKYLQYYLYLHIAFHYPGKISEFRGNLIQIAFSPHNNEVIDGKGTKSHEISAQDIYLITEKANFIRSFQEYEKLSNREKINERRQYLEIEKFQNVFRAYMDLIVDSNTKKISSHNLIKILLVVKLYQQNERPKIVAQTEKLERGEVDSIVIQVIRLDNSYDMITNLQDLLQDFPNSRQLVKDVIRMRKEGNKKPYRLPGWLHLLRYWDIFGVVDDFLRFEIEKSGTMSRLPRPDSALEETVASLVVKQVEKASEYYRKNGSEFQGSLGYRKLIPRNYYQEVKALNRIESSPIEKIESNPYYLDLKDLFHRGYHSFTSLGPHHGEFVTPNVPLTNMIRQVGIDERERYDLMIERHHNNVRNTAALTGVVIAFDRREGQLPDVVTRDNLIDVRDVIFHYSNIAGKKVTMKKEKNGIVAFTLLMQHILIYSIRVKIVEGLPVFYRSNTLAKMNPELKGKYIYWNYSPATDRIPGKEGIEVGILDILAHLSSTLELSYLRYVAKIIQYVSKKSTKTITPVSTILHMLSYIGYPLTEKKINRMLLENTTLSKNKPFVPVAGVEPLKVSFPENLEKKVEEVEIDMIGYQPAKTHIELKLGEYRTGKEKNAVATQLKTCPHEMEWKRVTSLLQNSLNVYNRGVEEFMGNYAVTNKYNQQECRLCRRVLSIGESLHSSSYVENYLISYIPGGSLANVREYGPYRATIESLDGIIQRCARALELYSYLEGIVYSEKSSYIIYRRNYLIKQIVDLLNLHADYLCRKYKNESEIVQTYLQKYGLRSNRNSFIIMPLTPNILSRDANNELRSFLVYNNLLVLIILLLVLELSAEQIIGIYWDKTCNIEKYFANLHGMFSGIRVKSNITDNETMLATDMPILCYLVFTMGHVFQKYSIWKGSKEPKKLSKTTQENIIVTFFHILNSILEACSSNPDEYVYRQIRLKYFSRTKKIFASENIISATKARQSNATKITNTNISLLTPTPVSSIPTLVNREPVTFLYSAGSMFDEISNLLEKYTIGLTGTTNCNSGAPIDYQLDYQTGKLVPTASGKVCEVSSIDADRTEQAYYYHLGKLVNKKCITGGEHQFATDRRISCTRCPYQEGKEMSTSQLDKYAENWYKLSDKKSKEEIEKQKKITANATIASSKTVESLQSFQRTSGCWSKLINGLTNLFDKEVEFTRDETTAHLTQSVFSIDHNYQGISLGYPVTYKESDNRVKIIYDDPVFGTHVYTYLDKKHNVDVYYHFATKQLLGYRVKQKNHVFKKLDNFLVVKHSIKELVAALGQRSIYTRVPSCVNTPLELSEFITQLVISCTVEWKHVIDTLQRKLSAIKNKSTRRAGYYLTTYPNVIIPNIKELFPDWVVLRNSFGKYFVEGKKKKNLHRINLEKVKEGSLISYQTINAGAPILTDLVDYYSHACLKILETNNNSKTAGKMLIDLILDSKNESFYPPDWYGKNANLIRYQLEHGNDRPKQAIVELTNEEIEMMVTLEEGADVLDLPDDFFE